MPIETARAASVHRIGTRKNWDEEQMMNFAEIEKGHVVNLDKIVEAKYREGGEGWNEKSALEIRFETYSETFEGEAAKNLWAELQHQRLPLSRK